MRTLICTSICLALAVGCGGSKKPAEDPAATTTADETPKWDSTSETADTTRRSKDLASTAKKTPKEDDSTAATTEPVSGPPKQRRSDEYDKEGTEVVLKRAARQVKQNCGAATDEDGKVGGPWGSGQMHLVLGHNGRLKEATLGPPFEGKPTGKCALQAFSRLTYPPWAGSDMTLDWPIEIVPPADPKKK
ncbi:MAG: hypothetical protein IPG50_32925 [Myxococcales bacterium]|nr:hypothetical protein [Myxococcales bacterium]